MPNAHLIAVGGGDARLTVRRWPMTQFYTRFVELSIGNQEAPTYIEVGAFLFAHHLRR